MCNRKFAFAGYDTFLSTMQTLVECGWQMTHHFPSDVEGMSAKLNEFGTSVGSQNIGPSITTSCAEKMLRDGTEILFVSGYPHRVDNEVLSAIDVINIHPSYLPIGRGRWPLPHIIQNGGLGAGVTFHLMTECFDEGPIIAQRHVRTDHHDSIHTLLFKQIMAAEDIARDISTGFENQLQESRKQNEKNIGWSPTDTQITEMDWSDSVDFIDLVVRSNGNYGTHTKVGKKRLLVYSVQVWKETHSHPPGKVIYDLGDGPLIAAKDGYVFLANFEMDENGRF